jgi:nitrogenase molybdenum-iron protein alpha/beta subunit
VSTSVRPPHLAPLATFPYLHGVVLAVNAIADAWLLLDAPSCNTFRVEDVYGTHDWSSTLVDHESRHRVVVTNSHIDTLVADAEGPFGGRLRALLEAAFVPLVITAASPVNQLVGTAYDDLIAELAEGHPETPVAMLPARALEGDWIEGYDDVLAALARTLPLAVGEISEGKVALIGYLMDRNEADHTANLELLRGYLEALDLELVSVWLGGGSRVELERAAEAGSLLVLPGGEVAARTIARRTGAREIPVPLPLGVDASERFIRAAAGASADPEAGARADALIEREAVRWAPRLRWPILNRVMGSRWLFEGNPRHFEGIHEIARFCGADVVGLLGWSRLPVEALRPPGYAGPLRSDLTLDELSTFREQIGAGGQWDLLIGPHEAISGDPRALEFGYRSVAWHALRDTPFLGFEGFVQLLGRIVAGLPNRAGVY